MNALHAVEIILHDVVTLNPELSTRAEGWQCNYTWHGGTLCTTFAPDLPYLALVLVGLARNAGMTLSENALEATRVLEALRGEEGDA